MRMHSNPDDKIISEDSHSSNGLAHQHQHRHQHLFGFVWSLFILTMIITIFTFTFFLTSYLYSILDIQLSTLYVQLINSFLGLICIGIAMRIISGIARTRGWIPERNVFGPVIDALEKIAKGDFSIRLDNQFHDHQMISELTGTVNRMAQELGQMENMRQEFVSNVSHEIQSPLTSISGFAEALEDDQLDREERHHYLNIIKAESKRLSRLSDNLLRLASLESETLKLSSQRYRLDEQLRALILSCEPQWIEKGVEMEVFLDEVTITADKDMLGQVWINLINNSVKYTPEGGKIRIYLYQQDGKIIFEITDTGIGIEEKEQKNIFERFYKTDKSRQPSQKGNGLGLSIVKKIVDLHQGIIKVSSNPGKGATFIVYLPVKN